MQEKVMVKVETKIMMEMHLHHWTSIKKEVEKEIIVKIMIKMMMVLMIMIKTEGGNKMIITEIIIIKVLI